MRWTKLLSRWQGVAWVIGIILSMPLLSLLYTALGSESEVYQHLQQTVLGDYILNTVLLVIGVCAIACLVALPLGWLVAYCEFPGKKHFSWALMLPLAMPSYIIAYIYTDFFDYAGPVQRNLRVWFDWHSPSDYWFFDMRTLGGATLMLALVLYPYIYLIFKTALKEQSLRLLQAAEIMGKTPRQSFFAVSLPLSRGAIVAGVALVAMESMADFATVHYFAVNTLTTAVYDTWLGYYSLAGAAKIAAVMLVMLLLIFGMENFSRRNKVVYERQQVLASEILYKLDGWKGWSASLFCTVVLLIAFIFPVGVLINYALTYWRDAWQSQFWLYAWQSFYVSAWVCVLAVVLSVVMNYAHRLNSTALHNLPAKSAAIGYALPGTVLAVAVLIPLTWLDDKLNQWFEGSEFEPGLLLSGTIFALIFAYLVRFFAIAHGALESSFKRISPSLDMASYSLGKSRAHTLTRVHLPLLKKGMLTAGLLVFIECMKELPAALLLRPFNFETLATHVYQFVSDEQLELASLSALLIVFVGLVPLYLVNRSMEGEHGKS
ncbi:Ferric iron ABC transporter, permease protein [Pseudoalteromonas luteoviolacea B = ATCC 29581]|nr:Ferric iron ABC transporter, permease protein [Pseudoalteromonas luteoviolacea B = ATCC 29581]